MALGDPNAVFRPSFSPELAIRRRRYWVAPVIPPPPEGSLHGDFRKIRRPPPPLPRPSWAYHARGGVHRHTTFGNEDLRTTQAVRLTVGATVPPQRITQVARIAVGTNSNPLWTTQIARLVVGRGVPCVTQWQQLWRITRKDGVVFRYTSLDRDYVWGSETFKSCGGMNPNASEDASQVGAVGSQELVGIFKDDGITEAQLYGGLFNDAFVEVYIKSYAPNTKEVAKRIAAGWTGNLQHGDGTFNMEVLGPGSRTDQQAVVQLYGPQCTWVFGSPECGADAEALKISGIVTFSASRGRFIGELDGALSSGVTGASSGAGNEGLQWAYGRARWITGRNTGLECEIKAAVFDFGAVDVELWKLTGFLPESGDEFELLPGCDLDYDGGCKLYGQRLNFGGFPDVPGEDSVTATPDQKVN